MPNPTPRIYWCANVFVHYVDATPEHIDVLDQVLLDAEQEKVQLLTSAATIVEVAFASAEKAQGRLDPAVEAKINTLWSPPSPVSLVEFHQGIAESARDMIREAMVRGWSLKPYDAVHLASARWVGVQDMHTYDDPLTKYSPHVGFTIRRPSALQTGLFPPPPR